MDIFDELSIKLERTVPAYSFILDNGQIIHSTIDEESLMEYIPYIPSISEQMSPGSYIRMAELFISRITENFFLFLYTDLEEEIIQGLLSDIVQSYGIKIERLYRKPPDSLKNVIQRILFSMARSAGPEPIDWIPQEDIDLNHIYKISMKSMLNLADEIDGAYKKMMSMQPFLQYDAVAIQYFFQIPFKTARGNAFDCCITMLVDYNDRAIIHEKHKEVENILDKASENLIDKFLENADNSGNIPNNLIFRDNLYQIEQDFDQIPLRIEKTERVIDEMINSLKSLKSN